MLQIADRRVARAVAGRGALHAGALRHVTNRGATRAVRVFTAIHAGAFGGAGRPAMSGAAHAAFVGERARSDAGGEAAFVVAGVTHAAQANQRRGSVRAVSVEGRALVRRIRRNSAAVADARQTSTGAFAAPLALGAIGVDVATVRALAEAIRATGAGAAHHRGIRSGARTVTDGVTALIVRVVADRALANQSRRC